MSDTNYDERYFEEIRPFYDSEVPEVVERLLQDPEASKLLSYLLGDRLDEAKHQTKCATVSAVKSGVIAPLLKELLSKTSFSYTSSGKSTLDKTGKEKYTFVSNHRDIILDSAILNLVLLEAGMPMPEIAIGDNLLLKPWIRDAVRLSGAFIVKRSPSVREMLEESKHLSAYMRRNIVEGRASQWIAQREGRAKDSDDRTQQSVLKMLTMSGDVGSDITESLSELNIVPVAFSYEYDPCDYLKALELLQKARGTYRKEKKISDILSMKTGLMGQKGRIHVAIGTPLSRLLDAHRELLAHQPRNESLRTICEIIDDEIFARYRFYPCNYVAYDLLHGGHLGEGLYSNRERITFELYIEDRLDLLREWSETRGERDFLYSKLLEMYSNPLKNHLELKKRKGI